MTLGQEMAVAVLRGEKGTALILAQKLMEEHVAGRVEAQPITTLEIPAGKKKMILTIQPEMIEHGNFEVDEQAILEGAREWLNGGSDVLVSIGFNCHVFVEPQPVIQPPPKTTEEAMAALAKYLRETEIKP